MITGHPKDEALLLGYYDSAFSEKLVPDYWMPNLFLYKDYRAWYYIAGYLRGNQDKFIRYLRLGKW